MKYTNVGETSVFLEDFSYLRGILSAKILRSAKEIILFENAFPERTINVNKVKEFVKIVGGHALVRKFPKAQNNSLNWQINKLSLNINNNLEPKYKKSCGYRAVSKILQTDKLGLIFKHRMMDFLSRRGLYIKQAEKLSKEYKNVIFIPGCNDLIGLEKQLLGEGRSIFAGKVPYGILLLNRLENFLSNIVTSLKFFIYPFWLFVRIGVGSNQKAPTALYGMQVFRGISRKNIQCGRLVGIDSAFIYDDESFKLGNVAQFFWTYISSQIEKEETKEVIIERGGKFLDADKLKMPPNIFFKTVLYGIFVGITACFRGLCKGEQKELLNSAFSLFHLILSEMRLCSSINTKVFLSFDDQSVRSAIRTILLNKKGIKHFGHQHSAQPGPYLLPHLAYVHFNKYLVYGRKYVEMFTPYWNNDSVEIIGHWRVDYNFNATKDEKRKAKFNQKFGGKYNILVTPHGDGLKNIEERVIDFYKGLKAILTIDPSIHIIYRPRTMSSVEKYIHLLDDEVNKGRITVEMLEFNTYDLVVNVDMLITACTSSIFIDGACAGKSAVAYDFDNAARLIFGQYDEDFVVDSASTMVKAVKQIFEGRWNKKESYSRICNDFNAFYDGNSVNRIRDLMKSCVKEA